MREARIWIETKDGKYSAEIQTKYIYCLSDAALRRWAKSLIGESLIDYDGKNVGEIRKATFQVKPESAWVDWEASE